MKQKKNKTAAHLQSVPRFFAGDKLGFVGVFLKRTKYKIRVGRGLAPAAGFAVNYGTVKTVPYAPKTIRA